MNRVKELAAKVALCESLDYKDKANAYMLDIEYPKAQDDLAKAANIDLESAWDVFRNGTDEEFCGLINLISCGMEENFFYSDAALRELVKISKQRLLTAKNKNEFMLAVKAGLWTRFDRFWNETETSPMHVPVAKAQTFSQMRKQKAAAN